MSSLYLSTMMTGNKPFLLCCSCLALTAIAVFFVQQLFGLAKFYTEPLLRTRDENELLHRFDFRDPRLFAVKTCSSNKSCSWEEDQTSRRKLITDTCRAVHKRSEFIYPRLMYELTKAHKRHLLKFLLVIDSLQLVYCSVPKVGTTSWKRLLLVLQGNFNSTENLGQKETHNLTRSFIRNLNSYSLQEARRVLATYKKFLFVRNPFERILSAYQDKFQNNYPASRLFRKHWSERIIRYSGGSHTDALLSKQLRDDGTFNVTFSQFARFVGAALDSDVHDKRNEHWMETYRLCHPCFVDYDWIGHYDSLQTDADRILEAAGVDASIKFPNFTTNPTGSSDAGTLLRYYSQLSPEEITAIYGQYLPDFRLFGFGIPTSIRTIVG